MNDAATKRAQSLDAASAAYLAGVGRRLRHLRAQRGMTQRLLAARSGVSERHIALLEAGTGNISILLLRRLARALGADIAALTNDAPDRPLELVMLEQTLAQMAPAELAQARTMLLERFAAPSVRLRRHRIALVGLRGAGKSSLGRRLADLRDVPFIELDQEIERDGGMALGELFELRGQEGFRALEHRALSRLIAEDRPMVIATGGSLVTEPRTYELLLANCLTVWIRAAPEDHMQRVVAQGDLRPMAHDGRDMDDLRAILGSREALYARADLRLDTTGRGIATSLAELARLV